MEDEFETILIVYLSSLRIFKDLVCLRNFFELLLRLLTALVLVRVPFESGFPVDMLVWWPFHTVVGGRECLLVCFFDL